MKTSLLIFCVILGFGALRADNCGKEKTSEPRNTNQSNANKVTNANAQTPTPVPTPARNGGGANGEIRMLAQGTYGTVSEPFVLVARDREVYAALRALVDGLPELGADFFKSNAVVAAFLGTRNTGGYQLQISRAAQGDASGLLISEQTPPAGAMLTQALTNPFAVASVPARDEDEIRLQLRGRWAETLLRPYRVESGEFESSGGIAGRSQKFALEGTIGVARLEGFVTVLFDLKGAGTPGPRALRAAATGLVRADGGVELSSFSAGTLVTGPRSPLRATGAFAGGEDRLTLSFGSLPPRVADGFSGTGRLEARAAAPAAPRNRDRQ